MPHLLPRPVPPGGADDVGANIRPEDGVWVAVPLDADGPRNAGQRDDHVGDLWPQSEGHAADVRLRREQQERPDVWNTRRRSQTLQ